MPHYEDSKCPYYGGGGCVYVDKWCPFEGNKDHCDEQRFLGEKSYFVQSPQMNIYF